MTEGRTPVSRAFDAVIEPANRGGAVVSIPFDVKEVFGSGRPKVRALIDGHEYRGSLVKMGGRYILGIRKDIRAAIGKDVGDSVHVETQLDTAPRTVDVPPELRAALAEAADASERYDGLSFTHRREFAQWVAEAVKEETRLRRARKAVEMIREGRTH